VVVIMAMVVIMIAVATVVVAILSLVVPAGHDRGARPSPAFPERA
jgi:hypothetical protein